MLCSSGNTCILICVHFLFSSLHTLKRNLSSLLSAPIRCLYTLMRTSWISLFWNWIILTSSDCLLCLILHPIRESLHPIFVLLWWICPINLSCTEDFRTGHSTPDLSHQCRAQRQYHLSQPAGNISPKVAWNAVGLLCCKVPHCVIDSLSTLTLRTISAELLCSWSFTTKGWGMGLFIPRFHTLPLFLTALPLLPSSSVQPYGCQTPFPVLHHQQICWQCTVLLESVSTLGIQYLPLEDFTVMTIICWL